MSNGNDPTQSDRNDGADAGRDANAGAADDLALLRRERDEYFEQLQRSRADFSNYQKRARAQAEADRQFAVADLGGDLLAVIDNFERAAEAARSAGNESIVAGLDMVHKQLLSVLAKHGIEPITAIGQPFDPNRHEALVQQPAAEHPEGTVVAELGRGYTMRDRVLRPTKVAVSIKPQ